MNNTSMLCSEAVFAANHSTDNTVQEIYKLNTTQRNQTMQNTAKQNYPGSVAS